MPRSYRRWYVTSRVFDAASLVVLALGVAGLDGTGYRAARARLTSSSSGSAVSSATERSAVRLA